MGINLFKSLKNLMTSSPIWWYDVIIVIFDLSQHQEKWNEVFAVFLRIKIKFGVWGNFGLLISNLCSKLSNAPKVVNKYTTFFLFHQKLTYLLLLKHTVDNCLRNDISLVKITWTIFEIFSKNPQNLLFSCCHTSKQSWDHSIEMTMTSSKLFLKFHSHLEIAN